MSRKLKILFLSNLARSKSSTKSFCKPLVSCPIKPPPTIKNTILFHNAKQSTKFNFNQTIKTKQLEQQTVQRQTPEWKDRCGKWPAPASALRQSMLNQIGHLAYKVGRQKLGTCEEVRQGRNATQRRRGQVCGLHGGRWAPAKTCADLAKWRCRNETLKMRCVRERSRGGKRIARGDRIGLLRF